MLPAHRKMSEADVQQMMNMRKVGITTQHIYGSFACDMGGFEKLCFRKKDMYNEIDKQRRKKGIDAKSALAYLQQLKSSDGRMYWRHTTDDEGYVLGTLFGIVTTSRVEGLHSLLGKFVNTHNNFSEFIEHHHRCLSQMRFKEVEADFDSIHGQQELQTELRALERSASKLYTKEVVLQSASRVNVTGERRSGFGFIYTVTKYRRPSKEWHVFFWPSTTKMRCSCQRMESIGIPCDHLVAVIVYLHMEDIPESLVLKRWTMCAKDSLDSGQCTGFDPLILCRFDALHMSAK
ncbi:Zinc finger, PMZ-type [Sesbania bispinosa]|nr:Zinc finger, PMZ-type [Sesbania bispinosa]